MTIAAQLLAVRAALTAWARSLGGTVEIAGDPFHLLGLLQNKPGGLRVAILFQGETKRGEYEEAGLVDRNFSLVLSRGRGLAIEPADSLVATTPNAGGTPLFDLVEQARDLIRGLQFENTLVIPLASLTTEVTPNYLGSETFAVEGRPIDAYQLNFQIGTQLPAA